MEHTTINIQSWVGNGISLGAIAVSFLGYIPAIAAAVALVWYLIQIYESATVQTWLRQRQRRRVSTLKAKLTALELELMATEALPDDEDSRG